MYTRYSMPIAMPIMSANKSLTVPAPFFIHLSHTTSFKKPMKNVSIALTKMSLNNPKNNIVNNVDTMI